MKFWTKSLIYLLNKFVESGETMWAATLRDPADSPNIVTMLKLRLYTLGLLTTWDKQASDECITTMQMFTRQSK